MTASFGPMLGMAARGGHALERKVRRGRVRGASGRRVRLELGGFLTRCEFVYFALPDSGEAEHRAR